MDKADDRYVLILEDNGLQAWDLVKIVEQAGFEAVGPFSDCASALESLEDFVPDAALLDICLQNGETSQPVADALSELDVPFGFISGFAEDRARVMPQHLNRRIFSKPYKPSDVVSLASTLANESPAVA